ncbi:Fumarylacetoacetate hydrolase domain-containing protein 2 [Metarhizium anisopliae]
MPAFSVSVDHPPLVASCTWSLLAAPISLPEALTLVAQQRLVRFLARDGRTYYGDAILPKGVTDIAKTKQARVVTGDIFGQHQVTDQVADVRLLLPPLDPAHVKTVRCLGLNYADHAKETKMPQPQYPILFYKPATSLSGPSDPIPIPHVAQEGTGLDYECELVIVIGKRATDVSESEALDYVLGYSVGNDVSHRDWQIKRGGGQWSHGKGFDGWAPYGPGIVTTDVIKDPHQLKIWTKVNGEILQNGSTADLIFGVRKTVSLLSRGVTLLPGDIIFTGTPAGVGMGRSPQVWLKDGDVVEVGLEQVGTW